jgi:Uma2 family endonuclease
MLTLQLRQIDVPPGQRVLLHEINWQEFGEVIEELGENRASRIAYYAGTLEIRMPLPEHEKAKVIVGHLLVALLNDMAMDWESLGSTTFKNEQMKAGIEPDDCFYIKNYAAMIGKDRIDLSVDPPPDLAIEIDLTSNTQVSAYEALGISEIWRYKNRKLQVSVWKDGKYVESQVSPSFPDFPVIDGISRFVEMSREIGMSAALRGFCQWLKERKQTL